MGQTSATAIPPPSHPHSLSFSFSTSPSFSSLSQALYAHMCAGHEVALLAVRREALAWSPPPRWHRGARCCRCCMSLGRRCRRRYASGGARRCHIDRALVTGEPTSERVYVFPSVLLLLLNVSLFFFFFFVSCAVPHLSFSRSFSLSLAPSFESIPDLFFRFPCRL